MVVVLPDLSRPAFTDVEVLNHHGKDVASDDHPRAGADRQSANVEERVEFFAGADFPILSGRTDIEHGACRKFDVPCRHDLQPGGEVLAHPFDVDALEFTGDPRPIADDIWYEPSVTALTGISASRSGTVVFKAGGEERTELAWFDRSGAPTGTVWEPKGYVGVALSNDGTKLLAGFPGDGSERHIWLYDIPAGTLDQPDRVRPVRHVFAADRVDWHPLDWSLPAHGGDAHSPLLEPPKADAGGREQGG